jgi:hypothetical protein
MLPMNFDDQLPMLITPLTDESPHCGFELPVGVA